jgi:parallel beta-helix repeat protein
MNKKCEAGLPVTIEKYGGDSPGLYVDEEGNNYVIEHNTVIGSRLAGIYFHWAPGNLVRRNTLYGNGVAQIRLSGKNAERKALIEDVFLDNLLFATKAEQQTLYLSMNYNDVHFGQSDRNWFYHPYADSHIHVLRYLTPSSGEHHDYLTLSGWQALSGYDRNSKEFSDLRRLPQVTLASPVQSRIVYNASLQVTNIDLGTNLYCDVQGNGIRGTLVLQPFESKILIAAVEAVVTQQAKNPGPADGGQVGFGPALEWTAAAKAASHNIYLGTEKEAVSAADPASPLFRGRQTSKRFSLQGLVQPGTRYFWRVDEVEPDGTTLHKGAVWTFTVPNFLAIDDFEHYTDTQGSRLEETWSDGSLNHTGATVSRGNNLSTTWTDDTHGQWSMSLTYDNTKPPHLSEIERRFARAQDWTAGAADTLSLWFEGDEVSFAETSPGRFTLSAAGADTWGARDEFRYAYKRLDGDGAIVVKIEDLLRMDYWTKAGVMMRESLDPASAHAFMLVIPNGLRLFQNRPASHSARCFTAPGEAASKLPCWVKLERRGNQFTGYHSLDGVHWVRQSDQAHTEPEASPNPQTIHMPAQVYVGLALSSHAPGAMATATFSSVQVTGNVTDRWQVADIGVDHPGNSPDNLYVTVEDSSGKSAKIVHPDPAAVNARTWTEWKIPLTNFSGVDLRRVRRMSIGVGGRAGAVPLGTGRIKIDDIRVLP